MLILWPRRRHIRSLRDRRRRSHCVPHERRGCARRPAAPRHRLSGHEPAALALLHLGFAQNVLICSLSHSTFNSRISFCSLIRYLLEDQLKGASSIQAYITALRLGCRSIEGGHHSKIIFAHTVLYSHTLSVVFHVLLALVYACTSIVDVHDGPVDEPIVFNGNTLTGKILVRDVLEVISKYAFETNPYAPTPIWVLNNTIARMRVLSARRLQLPGDPEHFGRLLAEAAGAPAPLPLHDSRLAARAPAGAGEGGPEPERSPPAAFPDAAHGQSPRAGARVAT